MDKIYRNAKQPDVDLPNLDLLTFLFGIGFTKLTE